MRISNLIGQTVDVGDNDQTYAIGLIQYLYPNHKIMQPDNPVPQSNKLIFIEGYSFGKLVTWQDRSDKEVICVVSDGDYNIDFTNRAEVLRFVYGKWDIDIDFHFTEDETDNIQRMELFDFYNFIKPHWTSKDLCLFDDSVTKVNIHSVIGQGFNEILRFSDSITDENVPYLEMGFIHFIETALITRQNSKAYARYNERYKRFYMTLNTETGLRSDG